MTLFKTILCGAILLVNVSCSPAFMFENLPSVIYKYRFTEVDLFSIKTDMKKYANKQGFWCELRDATDFSGGFFIRCVSHDILFSGATVGEPDNFSLGFYKKKSRQDVINTDLVEFSKEIDELLLGFDGVSRITE